MEKNDVSRGRTITRGRLIWEQLRSLTWGQIRGYARAHVWPPTPIQTLIAAGVVLLLILGGYAFEWTGFAEDLRRVGQDRDLQRAKMLWDWLDLLIVPFVVALGGALITAQLTGVIAKQTQIAEERRTRETSLREYLVQMEQLLTDKRLRDSKAGDVVNVSARALTLTVLQSLDVGDVAAKSIVLDRRLEILRFLREAELIEAKPDRGEQAIIRLTDANLQNAQLDLADLKQTNLAGVDLRKANLYRARLIEANLRYAKLAQANLQGAFLNEADLTNADLTDADLTNAYLIDATVTQEQLDTCKSLAGATMPDGTKRDQQDPILD